MCMWNSIQNIYEIVSKINITARKQSLGQGQGNAFTRVCYSVHEGTGSLSRGVSVTETPTGQRLPPYRHLVVTTEVGGTNPTGMHSCVMHVCVCL